uniref:Spondin domain-containing protein n=1 Tax=Grammatophora oceanica TaxID=210454 RepID=A0A7S1YHJ5_9STRA|mmetsp:Transcript_47345/g.70449  ORF Transcript_47345/g.70449 Transcript_47345/m.70449 type:complete len:312 (+) Transcript_47345:112-1047(+)|eukprot:CAMPEP_0194031482 /NCGR_PEP_ID=MMETSP0009_2-20130614/4643_1 /TAXON_ID=210454 /ORGANISM="Grammatophora oceanica, Strain CCMP 410" /LENGTH=311 /DNA_ID=CAMNT_0038671641 /DNA_START=130 /DNA_END=1065 /DNA_ORIENTATION=-
MIRPHSPFARVLLLSVVAAKATALGCGFADDYFADNYYKEDLYVSNETTLAQSEELALLLSPNNLLAPPELVEQIDADLNTIRTVDPKTNAALPALRYVPGELNIYFNDEAIERIQNGTYSLNHVDRIMSSYGPFERDDPTEVGMTFVTYKFRARYNTNILIEMLQPSAESIPGFWSLQPTHVPTGTGLWLTACASATDSLLESIYIFDFGWVDCTNDCACREVSAYSVGSDGVWRDTVHVGPRPNKYPGPDDCPVAAAVPGTSAPSSAPSSRPPSLEELRLSSSSNAQVRTMVVVFILIDAITLLVSEIL